MKVIQTDKAVTLDCGCNTSVALHFDKGEFTAVQGTLTHCPLHESALDLLAALKGLDLEDWPPLDRDDDCWFCEGRFITGKGRQHNEGCALVTALMAIKKADPLDSPPAQADN